MKQLICALLAALTLAGCGRLPEISRELPELPPVPSPTWERTEKEEGGKRLLPGDHHPGWGIPGDRPPGGGTGPSFQ